MGRAVALAGRSARAQVGEDLVRKLNPWKRCDGLIHPSILTNRSPKSVGSVKPPEEFRLEVELTDDATRDGIAWQDLNRVRRSRADHRRSQTPDRKSTRLNSSH